jgi:mannose-1-phosphate guanylyltransferase/mannose-6-phosphate isomerase
MEQSKGRCFAAILAGGAGTRFWPASRAQLPKPFLDLFGAGPLVGLTRDRMVPVVGDDGLFFVLGESLLPALEAALPGAPALGEPIARNTLGAVLLAMGYCLAQDPEARLAILPADHVIGDLPRFRETMDQAFTLAQRYVVTIGVVPSYPETGYGYIRKGARLAGDGLAFSVDRFAEKPDLDTAARFVASGEYVWNAGMFVLPVAQFRNFVASVDPYYGEVVDRLAQAVAENEVTGPLLAALLEPLPNLNIDKAVMEQCPDLVMIPAAFPWSDVGTWDAVFDQREADEANLLVGDVLVNKGSGNVVVSTPGAPAVAVHNADDLVVVATQDAVLVTRRGQGQSVKEVVDRLRDDGRHELL